MPYLPAARTCPNFCPKIEMRLAMRTFGPLSLLPETVYRRWQMLLQFPWHAPLVPASSILRISDVGSASGILHQTCHLHCNVRNMRLWIISPNRSSDSPTNARYPMRHLLSIAYLAPSKAVKAVVVPRLEERTCSFSILNFEGYNICVHHKISWEFVGIRRKTGCKGCKCNLLHNANIHISICVMCMYKWNTLTTRTTVWTVRT